ncbi:hypothetical protein AJ80_08838 [Polytolypa hystricis UAMH7299]|uniref:Uncharacterized protein n=1 Tax=Polytolypa hystricis (strain UAMH7299) TaxID=1447883 RepID=A0A2B7X141_POLH7|nr:hypothetical protein AJ80_08838 [Polytolypa hystricis UAMH7299]
MSLIILPSELVLMITDLLGEERDLNAFAQISRYLYQVTNPLLYQHNVRHSEASALPWAIQHAEVSTTRQLLDCGADVNMIKTVMEKRRSGDVEKQVWGPPFYEAVSSRRQSTMLGRILWVRNVLNDHTENRVLPARTPEDHDALLRLLIDRGADINVKNRYNTECGAVIRKAVLQGDSSMIRLLIEHGAHLEALKAHRPNVLHEAAKYNNLDIIQLLIDEGFDVNGRMAGDDRTPLHAAASAGAGRTIVFLLEVGADITARSKDGSTPLHAAMDRHDAPKSMRIARILLENGASINAKNNYGETPLMVSLSVTCPGRLVQFLLEWGADIHARDNQGGTMLHSTARDMPRLIPLLLCNGLSIDVKDDLGRTPLRAAAARPDLDVVEVLVLYGADIYATDNDGQTPLRRVLASPSLRRSEVAFLLKNIAVMRARAPPQKKIS